MPLAGLRRPTHEGSLRLIVTGVMLDVRRAEPESITGFNSIFRLRRSWAAHGFYGMADAQVLRDACSVAFDPIADDASAAAFERGVRRVAGIVLDGEAIGSEADEEVFWSALVRLGGTIDMEVPPLERLRSEGAAARDRTVSVPVSA